MKISKGSRWAAAIVALLGVGAFGASPASADPYDGGYWEAQLANPAHCFAHKGGEATPHGVVTGNVVTLAAFEPSWVTPTQNHWEAIIVGAGGNFKLYVHPSGGTGYTAPLVGETAPEIDYWFACKGDDPDAEVTTTTATATTVPEATTTSLSTTTTVPGQSPTTVVVATTLPEASSRQVGADLPETGKNTDLLLLAGTLAAAAGVSLLIVRRRPVA